MVFWRRVVFEIKQFIPNYVVGKHVLHVIISVAKKKLDFTPFSCYIFLMCISNLGVVNAKAS